MRRGYERIVKFTSGNCGESVNSIVVADGRHGHAGDSAPTRASWEHVKTHTRKLPMQTGGGRATPEQEGVAHATRREDTAMQRKMAAYAVAASIILTLGVRVPPASDAVLATECIARVGS
jgi:hypothetical protein